MNKCTIEDELNRSGRLLRTTVGDSMEPMLKNRQNVVVLEKAAGILKKYDLPLYKRPSGQYVLHRIIKVRKNDYIICGDNRWQKEKVPYEWVLGVVSGYYNGGELISVNDYSYRKYLNTLTFRRKYLWIRSIFIKLYNVVKISPAEYLDKLNRVLRRKHDSR